MSLAVTILTLGSCFWLWMRYQHTDQWRWLAIGAVVLIVGISTTNYVEGPETYASADATDCVRFRGNECY